MTRDELQLLIRLGEGFTCEFKQSGTAHLGRELCAFANATGGVVLIGVTDDGRPVGVRNSNRLKSEVQNIARSIEPPLVVETDAVDDILIVNIPAQNSKPYSSGGKFYLRDGASSQQMSRSEIREFFFKEGVIHFDETPCERFLLEEDLTDDAWRVFRNRSKIPQDMDAVEHIGSGIKRIKQICNDYGVAAPEIQVEEDWFTVSFPRVSATATPQVTPQVGRLLAALAGDMTRTDLMEILSLKDRMYFSQGYLQPALDAGLVEMTLPDKPHSSKQKYRLTAKGDAVVKDQEQR